MNIFWIVVVAVGVLLIAALFMRRQEPSSSAKTPTNPIPDKPSPAKPVQKLPPAEARKWLDDFLVKQQDKDAV